MQKKSLKKGIVKRIERDTNAIVVLGPINKDKGTYMEKKLNIHCLSYFDESKSAAFDFLRTQLVGKEIEFNDYDISGVVYADIFLESTNVGFRLAAEGLAEPHRMGEKTSYYYDDLAKANEQARKEGKGQYFDEKAAETGEKKNKKKKKAKLPALEELVNKEVTGYIEDVNFELDFQIYIHEIDKIVRGSFAGVQIPVKSKEHVISLKNYLGKHVYQRDRKFKIKTLDQGKLTLVEQHAGDEGSIMRKLFAHGWARLEQEATQKLETIELLSLKALQDQGMHSLKGIWKDYKGKLPQSAEGTVSKESQALHALLTGPAFDAVVVEVHSGDTLTIEMADNQKLRVSLTNVKARGMGNFSKGEEPQPWAFEAKEALRRRLIGKSVRVKIDNIRNVKTEDREFDIVNATIWLGDDPVAVELLQKGLVAIQPPKMNDPSSQELQKYAEAAQTAETQKKGIHSNSTSIKRFWDLSKPDARGKAKDFNLESYKDLTEGVVEAVIAGARFKVRFDKENCYFILSLNGVRAVPNNKNMPVQEKWATEALEFSKRKTLQRTVKFEIDTLDRLGIAHGTLFIDGKNIGEQLLSAGLAYVEKNRKSSRYINDYLNIEAGVKAKKKGIWGEPDLDMGSLQEGEAQETNESKNVVVSEVFAVDDFYLQEIENPNFELVEKVIKEKAKVQESLAEPILAGTLAIGLFDGQYYRVRVFGKKGKKDQYEVFFVDFGNRDNLGLKELKKCPKEIQNIPNLAFRARLEYIQTAPSDSVYGTSALEIFKKLTLDVKLVADIKRREGTTSYCVLKRKGKEFNDIRKSVNMALVREGLAIVDSESSLANDFDWIEASKAGLQKNPDAIAALNNVDY